MDDATHRGEEDRLGIGTAADTPGTHASASNSTSSRTAADPLHQDHPNPQYYRQNQNLYYHEQQEHRRPGSRDSYNFHDDPGTDPYHPQFQHTLLHSREPLDKALNAVNPVHSDHHYQLQQDLSAQIFSSLGEADSPTATESGRARAPEAVTPDDFYRGYSGASSASHDQRQPHANEQSDYMATSATAASRAREHQALRSETNGMSSRHPPLASHRNGLTQSSRSVSAPIDGTNPGAHNGARQKPSVKDLMKRFDQQQATNAATPSSIPRPPVRTGMPTRFNRSATAGESRSSPTAAPSKMDSSPTTPYSTLRTSVDPDLTPTSGRAPGMRSTQRAKFAAEDQLSNNTQSFASRIGKPKNASGASALASKSTSNIAHKSSTSQPSPASKSSSIPVPPPPPAPSSIPIAPPHSQAPPQGLLFGEILPDQYNDHTVGFGIEGPDGRPRRTSESSVHPARIAAHQRTLSDPDMFEPPSPTDWYRIINSQPKDLIADPAESMATGHARSTSEATSTETSRFPPTQGSNAPSPTSRLPVSVRKVASPAPSLPPSCPPSGENSRAASPVHVKRPQQQQTPSGRSSRTNNHRPGARAKTPTQTNRTRQVEPRNLVTPTEGTRLNAVVEPPVPKLSPPLRSSRPRQSVATATTASSRRKANDRAKSPHQLATRNAQKQQDPAGKRPKVPVGPVDFAQRRETIRLAYSKSIRETQAREASRRAADRRRKQLEAAAKAEATEAAAASEAAQTQQDQAAALEKSGSDDGTTQEPSNNTGELVPGALPSLSSPLPSFALDKDSPTLGIPGSFPAMSPPADTDEPPSSAVSRVTVGTEFEDEPQTNPPVSAKSTETSTGLGVMMPPMADVLEKPIVSSELPPGDPIPIRARSEYRSPFDDEDDNVGHDERGSIKVALEGLSAQRSPSATPQPEEFLQPHVDSNNLQCNTEEYEPLPYSSPSLETTVKILRRASDHEESPQTTSMPAFTSYEEPDYEFSFDQHDASAIRRYTGPETDSGTVEESAVQDLDGGVDDDNDDDDTVQRTEPMAGSARAAEETNQGTSILESDATDNEASATNEESHHLTPGTTHSLTVPTFASPNRHSQQSAWTDYSLESTDSPEQLTNDYFGRDDGTLPLPNPPFASRTYYQSGPSETSSARQSGHYSDDVAHLESGDGQSSIHSSDAHLPDLDLGEASSVPHSSPRMSRNLSRDVPLPDYEPPPVPASSSGSVVERRRPTSSAYMGDTRPGSTLVGSSIRDSEDFGMPFFMPSASTPQSIDHLSLEAPESSLGGQTPIESDRTSFTAADVGKEGDELSDKDRRRLAQRRNVIKELIDTEMVFVRDMNIVEEIYKGTAEACPRLDDNTIKLVFRNVDEIVQFHTKFLGHLKEAVAPVYAPQARRSPKSREASIKSDSTGSDPAPKPEVDDTKDRTTTLGPCFQNNLEDMRGAHEGFLRSSDHAAKRLIEIQQDPTVQVWLNECHEVAKDLTAAWDLDSLLIKPMQRITKYPNLIMTLLQHTPQDHPDRAALLSAKDALEVAIIEINKTKKNFELVGQIVGRKRKESDVKAGFARAFGKRVDKLQSSGNRVAEDTEYAKLHEKFGDDYLRLQVVLRDVEFYTRQVSAYVHEFLQYLSSMELVMRLQPGNYPELESKWVQFNVSMRDIQKVALDQHLSQVRKHVIEPFEHVIKAYGNPSLAMKKRAKRRLDYEKAEQLKKGGKTVDPKLKELVEQYDALNETLKKELPILSSLTEKVGNICLGNLVNIQVNWYKIWQDKVKFVLGENAPVPQVSDILTTFHRDYKFAQEQLLGIGILNPTYKGRSSQSTVATRTSTDDGSSKLRPRPLELSPRDRGRSFNTDQAPVLPTPDFAKAGYGGQISLSSPGHNVPSPHQYYYRDYYSGINSARPTGPPVSMSSTEPSPVARSALPPPVRPGTGRSYDSVPPRQSSDSSNHYQRNSNSAQTAGQSTPDARRYSGLFHSALPMSDTLDESRIPSRNSSRERVPTTHGYNVLWLAASLFEFNIETTKHEAGYPYLTYQAGEIFDVVAEKGELWLAKNQDDPREDVGWIWSKHFAKLADS